MAAHVQNTPNHCPRRRLVHPRHGDTSRNCGENNDIEGHTNLSLLARRAAQMRRCRSVGAPLKRFNFSDPGKFSKKVIEDDDNYLDFSRISTIPKCLLAKLSGNHTARSEIWRDFQANPQTKSAPEASGVFYSEIPIADNAKCNSFSYHSLFASPMPKLPKDVELTLRYLQEVIRSGKAEMFAGSSNAFFDALLQYFSTLDTNNNVNSCADSNKSADMSKNDDLLNDNKDLEELLKSMDVFLKWIDENILNHFQTQVLNLSRSEKRIATTNAISDQNANEISAQLRNGIRLLKGVEQSLRRAAHANATGRSPSQPPNKSSPKAVNSTQARQLSKADDEPHMVINQSPVHDIGVGPHKISLNTGSSNREEEEDDPIDRLLEQLRLRKVERFEPRFASIARPEEDADENTSSKDVDEESEDDSGVHVDEDHEERAEQHSGHTTDERIERSADGREIHKTRVINSTFSSKCVSLKSFSRGLNEPIVGGSHSKNHTFSDEFNTFLCNQPFNTKFSSPTNAANLQTFKSTMQNPAEFSNFAMSNLHFLPGKGVVNEVDDCNLPSSTVTRNAKHSSTTSQCVEKKVKRNGQLVLDDSAHRLDNANLDVQQIDVFQDSKMIDRRGEGSYEEGIVVGRGRPGHSPAPNSDASLGNSNFDVKGEEIPDSPPVKRNVKKYERKVGDENCEGKENFFKATTLACYITFNDNLRFYEEQQRKKVNYVFAASGSSNLGYSAPSTPDYVNLRHLLQASSDASSDDGILLPTQFLEESDESDVEKVGCSNSPSSSKLRTKKSPKTTTFAVEAPFRNASNASSSDHSILYGQRLTGSIFESLDVSEFLVLRAKEPHTKPNEVRGGPKTALIVYATQNCSLLYQEAFIVTYRSFVSSEELIQKLIRRYLYMSSEKKATHQKAARQTFSVLVRVVHELCSVELTRELISIITSFVYRLIRSGNFEFARILRRRLMEIIEEKSFLIHKSCPTSFAESQSRVPSIFEFRSSALAKQITYLDAELLNRIEPAEMLWWAEEQDERKSPNVVALTEHFNRVSYWVRSQVILQSDQRDREKYLLKFIKVMKQLRKMGNYNSYLAILSALDSGPIRRLDWSRSLRDQLAEHAEIMESSHSFKNYRNLLADTMPPCLPYIGLILQDLTFVHVGNPDYLFTGSENQPQASSNQDNMINDCKKKTRKNLLNYGKRWQQFAILDNIRRFKTWPYDIQRDDKVLSAFNNFSNFLPEEETWERSFEIKPRTQRQRQKLST